MSDKNIVEEARELADDFRFDIQPRVRSLLFTLAGEVERLRQCHPSKRTHSIDCAIEQKRRGQWGTKEEHHHAKD